MKIPIFQIKVNEGRRGISPEAVHELADSISKVGLMNPITVDQDYTLIAGLHRLEAAKLLGWAEIECNVIDLEGLMAELAEIDENLIRQNLDSIAHGEWLNRRKEIYEELYPETRNGGDRRSEEIRTRPARSDRNKSFAEDTAGRLGISKRTVQENIQLAKDLTDKAKEIVRGSTNKIKKKDMLKLSRLPAEQQEDAASQLAANTIRSVEEFHPVMEEPEPAEEQIPKLSKQRPEVSAPPSVKTGDNPTTKDLAADLKNPDKDRSPTPDTFVKSFSLSLQRICQNIKSFEVSGYASVFPALTRTHLDQIQQDIDSVRATLDDFITKLKGNQTNE